jgi:dienelactone hydrolase
MPMTTETFATGATPVPIDIFVPDATPHRRAVLILPGSAGLGPEYRSEIVSFADALVAKQIAAAIPHYFASDPPRPDEHPLASIARHYAAWRKACEDALAFMGGDLRFDAARMAVIGFSLGGHFALTLGLDPPPRLTMKCLVDFFGPTLVPPLTGRFERMPPVLIHHGEDDTLVFPRESEALMAKLRAAGKTEGTDFRFEQYPGQGHRFDAAALGRARATTVDFIDSTL